MKDRFHSGDFARDGGDESKERKRKKKSQEEEGGGNKDVIGERGNDR